LRGRAERLRGLAPVALSVCPRRITERVDTGELTVELVARESVVASLPALGDGAGARLLDDDAVTVYETDTSLLYVLWMWIVETSDGTVAGITACTDGRLRGLLINESDAAVAWATDRYTAYRREAAPVGA
jgi:hypothetical protein